jgi:hypothetical protein
MSGAELIRSRCLILALPAGLVAAPCWALADEPEALLAQAVAYEHGEGVPKDLAKAAALYCQAAKLGHAEGYYGLGWMYANGRGVPRDDGMAATLLDEATRRGHGHAPQILGFLGEPGGILPECLRPEPVAAGELDEVEVGNSPERRKVVELVHQLAPEYSVSPRLALAVIAAESDFNPRARSPKNAQGLMQLIPETAARFNVRNPYDPVQNIRGGLAYLRWLLAYYRGNVALVAAGYNAGEGAVDRYRGIPPYAETRDYVRRILQLFKKHVHPYDETVTEPSPELHRFRLAPR